MIGTVITGRGNKRSVIERERNLGFSKALAGAIKKYLRIEDRPTYKEVRTELGKRRQRRAKRVSTVD